MSKWREVKRGGGRETTIQCIQCDIHFSIGNGHLGVDEKYWDKKNQCFELASSIINWSLIQSGYPNWAGMPTRSWAKRIGGQTTSLVDQATDSDLISLLSWIFLLGKMGSNIVQDVPYLVLQLMGFDN